MSTRDIESIADLLDSGADEKMPDDLHQLAEVAKAFFRAAATVDDLLASESFAKGVKMLSDSTCPESRLLGYLGSTHQVISGMAAAALSAREISARGMNYVLEHLQGMGPRALQLSLRALHNGGRNTAPMAGQVLAEFTSDDFGRSYWMAISEFLKLRLDVGDDPRSGEWHMCLDDEDRAQLANQVLMIGGDFSRSLKAYILRGTPEGEGLQVLQKVGLVHNREKAVEWPPVVVDSIVTELVDQGMAALKSVRQNSVLFVGDEGVGKSSVLRILLDRLVDEDWIVFELSAGQLIAGQSHVGALEKRLGQVIDGFSGSQKAVWYVPDLLALISAGRHSKSNTGVLEMLAPYLRDGRIRLIGKVSPEAAEQLSIGFSETKRIFHDITVESRSIELSLILARTWNRQQASLPSGVIIRERLIDDACCYLNHYCRDMSFPGVLFDVLKGAIRNVLQRRRAGQPRARVSLIDLTGAICDEVGIPIHILRPSRPFSRSAINQILSSNVMGQDEAIGEVSDCVARILNGLARNDRRPLGVLFLAGGTGTGKTELAKSLADLMTGDPGTLLRIDMSELNSPDASSRLTGVPGLSQGKSLVSQVRQRPFSVVLLDEFEKAHPCIHRMFLQVFDEGRLTDYLGRTASFCNCLFVLTSNIGVGAQGVGTVGFGRGGGAAVPTGFSKSLLEHFSPELRNRLTDVLEFQPLSARVLDMIITKQLRDIHQMPRIATRGARIHLEREARDFLIRRCLSENLGARPLVRAIDKYVLGAVVDYITRNGALCTGCCIRVDVDEASGRLICNDDRRESCALDLCA